jgi:hypothetical protein
MTLPKEMQVVEIAAPGGPEQFWCAWQRPASIGRT